MDTLLYCFFKRILKKTEGVESIESASDLCKASFFYTEDLIQMLLGMNDDADGFSSEEILFYANKAYRELV